MPDALKVAMVDPNGGGGHSHYVYNLCQALKAHGCDIHVLTGTPYEVEKYPRDFALQTFRNRRPGGIWSALVALRRLRPDVVHFQGTFIHPFYEWVYTRAARHMSGAPLVYTLHNVEPHEDAGWEKPFVRRVVERSDGIVVHSQRARKEALDKYRLDEGTVKVVAHGNQKLFRDVSHLGKPVPFEKIDGTKDVLFFGPIRRYKGLMVLIETISKMRGKGLPVRLMVVGKDREDWPEYLAAMDEWGIRDSTLIKLGYLDLEDVGAYFKFADVCCLPYVSGSESGVLHTADAFEVPIVATATGGTPEAMEDGLVQAMVDPGDADALALALEDVLFNPDSEGVRKAREKKGEGKRNWSAIAENTLALYRQLARKG